MDALSFHYPSRPERLAIDHLTGVVQAGQTVAVVGPSGAGKTTLLDLLMRFHAPQSGRLLIDGVAIDQMDLADLREHIALVPQAPWLKHLTFTEVGGVQALGELGNTGRSTGPHLHYEIEHMGRVLDPIRAMSPLAWR